jgi:hypothetical protein
MTLVLLLGQLYRNKRLSTLFNRAYKAAGTCKCPKFPMIQLGIDISNSALPCIIVAMLYPVRQTHADSSNPKIYHRL